MNQRYYSALRVAEDSLEGKSRLKAITRRNTPRNLAKVIRDLNSVLRGFVNYFQNT